MGGWGGGSMLFSISSWLLGGRRAMTDTFCIGPKLGPNYPKSSSTDKALLDLLEIW